MHQASDKRIQGAVEKKIRRDKPEAAPLSDDSVAHQ